MLVASNPPHTSKRRSTIIWQAESISTSSRSYVEESITLHHYRSDLPLDFGHHLVDLLSLPSSTKPKLISNSRSTNHKPSIEAPAHIHQGNKSTLRALRNLGEIDAGYPEWEDDLTFSFEQFADDNELNMAKRAMLGVIDMLQTTMSIMYPDTIVITDPWPAPTSDPSLERYFQAANIPKVAEVFKRLLAALGAPGFKNLIDCYHDQLLTMKIVYGDYWGTGSPTDCQDDPDAIAYSNWETDDEHADEAFGVTCLCPMFFEEYKDYSNPTPPILYNAPSIDEGDVMDTVQIPCYTSSLTLLHGRFGSMLKLLPFTNLLYRVSSLGSYGAHHTWIYHRGPNHFRLDPWEMDEGLQSILLDEDVGYYLEYSTLE